jgi:ABC-type Na+ efflux pump permease subunit
VNGGWRRLLWAMVTKETRTTLRERHQVVALVAIFLVSLGCLLVPAARWAWYANRAAQHQPKPALATAPAATQDATSDADRIREALLPKNPALIRWAVLAAALLGGMIFALGFLTNSAIAAFAGEKEAKTLELALASPVSDTALLVGKCVASLVTGLAVGYLFLLLATLGLWVLLRSEMAKLPLNVPLHALVLSVPLIVLASTSLVIIAATGSARAETVKGAGQVIGIVIFLVIFLFSGVPALIRLTPLGPAFQRVFTGWLAWPFAAQYLGLVGFLLAINTLLFLIGRALVRRDQMLL